MNLVRVFIFLFGFLIFVNLSIPESYQITCDPSTIENEDGQCIPKCGEGTILVGDVCKEKGRDPIQFFFASEIGLITIGVLTGIGATVFGIYWTMREGRAARKREDLELIKQFGDQFTELLDSERNLETKIDCSIYAEKYLDTLEQIASLYKKDGGLRKDVADYFENNFVYGMTLKDWYDKEVDKEKKISGTGIDERWGDFRWWCDGGNEPGKKPKNDRGPFTKFPDDVLPDVMKLRYEYLPEENGLDKADLIELLRGYGKDLDEIVASERELETNLDCELYAERYLDTLEQIASLYNRGIISKKAADYFENKFAYGLTLKEWCVDKGVYNDNQQKERWSELIEFCDNYVQFDKDGKKILKFDKDGNETPVSIEPFDQSMLPERMTQKYGSRRK